MSTRRETTGHSHATVMTILFGLFLLPAVIGLAGCNKKEIKVTSEYAVVTLDNGAVFLGKPGEETPGFIILKDVYFAQEQVSEDKKEVKVNLIPRADNLHHPDFMQINLRHVVYIEPLAPNSKLGKIIEKARQAQSAAVPPGPPKPSEVKDTKVGSPKSK